jgi:hypothetical protein
MGDIVNLSVESPKLAGLVGLVKEEMGVVNHAMIPAYNIQQAFRTKLGSRYKPLSKQKILHSTAWGEKILT